MAAAVGGGGGGGLGTVTTFFPLDSENGYANLGTLDAGDAVPNGSGVIDTARIANRPQSYSTYDAQSQLVIPAGSFPNAGEQDWCLEFWGGCKVDASFNTLGSGAAFGLIDYAGSSTIRMPGASGSPPHSSYVMYHFAVIREGDFRYAMFNGAQLSAPSNVAETSFDFSGATAWGLRRISDSNNGVDGALSEIRFTLGHAVYNTAGYAPPTGPLTP